MVDILAHDIGKDPAQLRMENFIQPEQFPYKTPTGWSYDSGNYPAALQKAMDIIDYAGLRKEQAEKRERGELMGIGISSFTEIVGAGPSHDFDILGLKMFDCVRDPGPPDRQGPSPASASRPRARATRRRSPRSSPRSSASRSQDIKIEYGDTDTAPYGLGTYALALDAGRRRRHRDGVAQDPGQGPQARRAPPRGERGRPRVGARQVQRQGLARPVQDDPGDRVRGLHQPSRRGWRRASRRSTTTIRRT